MNIAVNEHSNQLTPINEHSNQSTFQRTFQQSTFPSIKITINQYSYQSTFPSINIPSNQHSNDASHQNHRSHAIEGDGGSSSCHEHRSKQTPPLKHFDPDEFSPSSSTFF